jgi:hypothetical protein
VQKSKDAAGLTVFFYLVQDLKCFVFSLVNLHFRVQSDLILDKADLRNDNVDLSLTEKYENQAIILLILSLFFDFVLLLGL